MGIHKFKPPKLFSAYGLMSRSTLHLLCNATVIYISITLFLCGALDQITIFIDPTSLGAQALFSFTAVFVNMRKLCHFFTTSDPSVWKLYDIVFYK